MEVMTEITRHTKPFQPWERSMDGRGAGGGVPSPSCCKKKVEGKEKRKKRINMKEQKKKKLSIHF